jgi:hypothetical protein
MTATSRGEPHPEHRREPETPKPRDTRDQGIVRDQRGQEQPADKERAQQTSKNE